MKSSNLRGMNWKHLLKTATIDAEAGWAIARYLNFTHKRMSERSLVDSLASLTI